MNHAVVQSPTPIPVVLTNPSDPLVLVTLIVTIIGVIVSGAAAYFAWRSIVWARKDFAISSEQASLANTERARAPELAVAFSGADDEVTGDLHFVANLSARYQTTLVVVNRGTKSATEARVDVAASENLFIYEAHPVGKTVVLKSSTMSEQSFLAGSGVHSDAVQELATLVFRANPGTYTIRWYAKSAEGAWPAHPASVSDWPVVNVYIIPAALEAP